MHVTWADSAQRDLDAALAYLQQESPRGARRVSERIFQAVGLLERFPEIAPASRHRGLRQMVVPRTPYLVIYRIEGDRVEVRAIVHASQRRRR